ncbi:hypothetical protein V8C44DRAFT_315032 [Trichoderma aethiopicum]
MILGTTSLQTRTRIDDPGWYSKMKIRLHACPKHFSLTHLHQLAAQSGKGGPKSNRSRPGWR